MNTIMRRPASHSIFAQHAGPVRGISIAPSGDVAVSCSTDCSVRLFRLPFAPFEVAGDVADEASAVMEFQGKHAFRGIDHHWSQDKFATAGAQVRLPASLCSWLDRPQLQSCHSASHVH